MSVQQKNELRKHIWTLLKNKGLSKRPQGDFGKIPDFLGSEMAAQLLSRTIEWDNSKVIFCSPDSAQRMVRELALRDGKQLIMASPKLKKGYFIIDPSTVSEKIEKASTINGALTLGKRLEIFPKVNIVVEGSVAVDKQGNRLGKGGGFGDREINELIQQNAINKNTSIVSTVHDIQIVEKVPTEDHDKKINMIVTPQTVMRLNMDQTIPVVR